MAASHYLPDIKLDLKLGIHNFSTTYGSEAIRRIDIISIILTAITFVISIFIGNLSLIGGPLLLISIFLQSKGLAQGAKSLENQTNFGRFTGGAILSSISMFLSVLGHSLF